MATLGTTAAIAALAMRGGSAKKSQGPPINAQSPDEEKFIRYVTKLLIEESHSFCFSYGFANSTAENFSRMLRLKRRSRTGTTPILSRMLDDRLHIIKSAWGS
jgi:hypothetical protein